jgi:hypothetical protein
MVIHWPVAICMIPILVGIAPASVAIWLLLRRTRAKPIIPVMILGLVSIFILAAFGPMLFSDSVTIDDHGIYQSTGFWWAPRVRGLPLRNLDSILIEARPTPWVITIGGLPIVSFKSQHNIWHARYGGRTVLDFNPGDLWERNTARVKAILEKRGITVDHTAP